MSTTTTVTMPTGQVCEMTQPPWYQMGTHAWLTKEQADFQTHGLAVLMSHGLVAPGTATDPDTDEEVMAFALVDPETGQANGEKVVLVVYQDGHVDTGLPMPSEFEAWQNDHAEEVAAVENGTMTPEEAFGPLPKGPGEDPFASCL